VEANDKYEKLLLVIQVALESVANDEVTPEQALQFIESQL
jgi:hypothetical protein